MVRSAATNEPKLIASYGTVEGRVLSLLSRYQLKFTLYDVVYDHGVTCYVQPGREDEIRRAWRQRVRVEGWISRDPTTGQPETMHDIAAITVIEEDGDGGFERARGMAPRKPRAPRAEEAIRRVRDAW